MRDLSTKKYHLKDAILHGDFFTRLSLLLMGAGMIGHRQVLKGILVFLCQLSFAVYFVRIGAGYMRMLPSLGEREGTKVWDESLQVYRYVQGDYSKVILLGGVVTCFVIAAVFLLATSLLLVTFFLLLVAALFFRFVSLNRLCTHGRCAHESHGHDGRQNHFFHVIQSLKFQKCVTKIRVFHLKRK